MHTIAATSPRARSNAILALAIAMMLLLLAGCSLFQRAPVAPGEDPVVVRAQQTHRLAFTAIDSFLKVENENRAWISANIPEIHAFAEKLRAKDQATGERYAAARLKQAWAAIELYRATPTSAAGTELENQLAEIEAIARQARAYLTTIQTNKR